MKSKLLMAIIGLMGLLTQPAAAEVDRAPLIASPWGGSLSVADQKASAAVRPALADANWNHEVCVIAYAYEEAEQKLAANWASLQRRKADFDSGTWAKLEQEMAQKQRHIAQYTRNIPKCKGQFFRPALESVCANLEHPSRFCRQLQEGALPGVELFDDRMEFAHGLAWNKIGDLFSKGVRFAPSHWRTGPAASEDLPPLYPLKVTPDGSYVFETENGPRMGLYMDDLLYHLRNARTSYIEAAADTGIHYIAATNGAFRADGSEPPTGLGQWAFSIDMMRKPKDEVADLDPAYMEDMRAKTGLVTDLGAFWQLPRLHLQAQVYDILVQSDFARFAVELRDGSHIALNGPAWFQPAPDDGSPRFGTSYASYQVHAMMEPSADDMRTILRADAAYLTAQFEMMVEDGSIDVITLRTPLTGMGDAWAAMNAEHGKTRQHIDKTMREWDGRIAAKERELANVKAKRAAALASAEREARAYIAANGYSRDCPATPGASELASASTDAIRARIRAVVECDRQWTTRAVATKAQLQKMQGTYRSLGGSEPFIRDEIARWNSALATRNQEAERFNRDLTARNQRVEADNRRIAQANANRPPARATSASQRRYRSQIRRRASSGSERTAADAFYAAQSKPYVSMFRDVTVPPKPTGYMGTGYW
ncbi:hypothetical protein [Tsuneonella suprasediminis]|uniref:hypothetical protein n=1 Tax=Tsuneonella suprasediminis TaxID=2306996 RepID=UPI002F91C4A0